MATGRRADFPTDARDIRDLLGFRLALLTTISDRKAQAQVSPGFGFNLGDWRVLGMIGALQPVTLAALAQSLYRDKGQLSRVVSALEGRGLVSSTRELKGRRSASFRLTPEGERQHRDLLSFAIERNNHLLDALTPEERESLWRILDKLTETATSAYRQVTGQNRSRRRQPRRQDRTAAGARAAAAGPDRASHAIDGAER